MLSPIASSLPAVLPVLPMPSFTPISALGSGRSARNIEARVEHGHNVEYLALAKCAGKVVNTGAGGPPRGHGTIVFIGLAAYQPARQLPFYFTRKEIAHCK